LVVGNALIVKAGILRVWGNRADAKQKAQHVLNAASEQPRCRAGSVAFFMEWYRIRYQHMDVVLDTNVLVAALKSSKGTSFRLLSRIDDSRIRLHVSTPLVVEYEAVLKREAAHLTPEDIEDLVDYLCLVAEKHEIFYLWRPVLRDPKDDCVLELAVKVQAAIITWNIRDFALASGLGIEVITPKDFLVDGRQ
jgi:putative PIN family toxin of toxin-antitoxin system